ncbi:MAG: hypothetical protein ACXWUN_11810 [Allosphingosinicella sp.]
MIEFFARDHDELGEVAIVRAEIRTLEEKCRFVPPGLGDLAGPCGGLALACDALAAGSEIVERRRASCPA